jgi:hypothetical protein
MSIRLKVHGWVLLCAGYGMGVYTPDMAIDKMHEFLYWLEEVDNHRK